MFKRYNVKEKAIRYANGFFYRERRKSIHLLGSGLVLILVPHPGEEGDEADGDEEFVEEGSDRGNEGEEPGEEAADEIPESRPECCHDVRVYAANIERIPGYPQAEKSYF
jgi:hypothetical protein